jgi:hypothetical protein
MNTITKCKTSDIAKNCLNGAKTGIVEGATTALVSNKLVPNRLESIGHALKLEDFEVPVKINPIIAAAGGAIAGGIAGCVGINNNILSNEYQIIKNKIELNVRLLKMYERKIKEMVKYNNFSQDITNTFNNIDDLNKF